MRIKAADFSKTVQGLMDKFGDVAESVLADAVWKTAGTAVKELKKGQSSPQFQGGEKYNKGWSRKLVTKRLYAEAIVYNKTAPGLAHLLEFGHAKRNGGRTRAFPHISPVNDQVEDMFVDNFTDALAQKLIEDFK